MGVPHPENWHGSQDTVWPQGGPFWKSPVERPPFQEGGVGCIQKMEQTAQGEWRSVRGAIQEWADKGLGACMEGLLSPSPVSFPVLPLHVFQLSRSISFGQSQLHLLLSHVQIKVLLPVFTDVSTGTFLAIVGRCRLPTV